MPQHVVCTATHPLPRLCKHADTTGFRDCVRTQIDHD